MDYRLISWIFLCAFELRAAGKYGWRHGNI